MKVSEGLRNRKLARTAILAFLVISILAIIVYASTSWFFSQDLSVPTGSLAVYSDPEATTLVGDGSNQSLTGLWQWNGGGWNATVYVKNNGRSIIDITVTISGYRAGWIVGYAIIGESKLFVDEVRTINLWIYSNPPPVSGDSTGSFTVTISAA